MTLHLQKAILDNVFLKGTENQDKSRYFFPASPIFSNPSYSINVWDMVCGGKTVALSHKNHPSPTKSPQTLWQNVLWSNEANNNKDILISEIQNVQKSTSPQNTIPKEKHGGGSTML